MDWIKFAENNSSNVVVNYIKNINPSNTVMANMLSKISVKKREEILRDLSCPGNVLLCGYYLGYIPKPNVHYLTYVGIEILPEAEARKIVGSTIYDAIAYYKRGFIDLLKDMTLLDDFIYYGLDREDDETILELLDLRPEWEDKIRVSEINRRCKDLFMRYPNTFNAGEVEHVKDIFTDEEVVDFIDVCLNLPDEDIDNPLLTDIVEQYSSIIVLRYAIDNDIPVNPSRMLLDADDITVGQFIELDNEIEYLSNADAAETYIKTGRPIFLKFKNKERDQLKIDYSRSNLMRSLDITYDIDLIFMFAEIQERSITDSDIEKIHDLGCSVEFAQELDYAVMVRILDALPLDRVVRQSNVGSIVDSYILELYDKYPTGVKRLWELYAKNYPFGLDLMAYYLPFKISERFRPSITQIPIFNYFQQPTNKRVHPHDISIKTVSPYH